MVASIKTIEARLGVDRDNAKAIRRLLDGTDDPYEVSKRCRKYVDSCYFNVPEYLQILYAIDEILQTCGVEYIQHKNDTYYRNYGLSYCNTGETYDCTVIYDHKRNRFILGDWGSILESKSCYV